MSWPWANEDAPTTGEAGRDAFPCTCFLENSENGKRLSRDLSTLHLHFHFEHGHASLNLRFVICGWFGILTCACEFHDIAHLISFHPLHSGCFQVCTSCTRISDKVPGKLGGASTGDARMSSEFARLHVTRSRFRTSTPAKAPQQKQMIFRIRQIAFSGFTRVTVQIFRFQNSRRHPCFHVTHVSSSYSYNKRSAC